MQKYPISFIVWNYYLKIVVYCSLNSTIKYELVYQIVKTIVSQFRSFFNLQSNKEVTKPKSLILEIKTGLLCTYVGWE